MVESDLLPKHKFLIMEYLRMIQYQPVHTLGDDWSHYMNLLRKIR